MTDASTPWLLIPCTAPLTALQAEVSATRVSAAEKALAESQKQGAEIGARLALAETDARLKVGSSRGATTVEVHGRQGGFPCMCR
jgi:hypothetical protein